MTKELILSHGEIFLVLVRRDGRSAPDIARALGFSSGYTYLSRLYMKEVLSKKLITQICAVLDACPSVFDQPFTFSELNARLNGHERRIVVLEAEKEHLQTKVALLNARLDECEQQRSILQAKRN